MAMARAGTVERWRQRLASYEASGLTQKEWSRRNGVSVSALTLWIKRLRSMSALVPIVVAKPEAPLRDRAAGNAVVEVMIGALRLRADASVDPTWLGTLLKFLV